MNKRLDDNHVIQVVAMIGWINWMNGWVDEYMYELDDCIIGLVISCDMGGVYLYDI